MELKDTIEWMISDDYKERFKAEIAQLEIRLKKLEKMIKKWKKGKLNFEPICSMSMYEEQVNGMRIYLEVLYKRAEFKGVFVED